MWSAAWTFSEYATSIPCAFSFWSPPYPAAFQLWSLIEPGSSMATLPLWARPPALSVTTATTAASSTNASFRMRISLADV